MVAGKPGNFYGVEFMFVGETTGEKFVGGIQYNGQPAYPLRENLEELLEHLPVQPPSQILLFLPAVRKPLFADGAGKQVGRHAGHTTIAAMLTCRLRPD